MRLSIPVALAAPFTLCALGVLTLAPTPAAACGGFFCDAGTQSPIYQAGERILFSQLDGITTMHIEVVYEGDPTGFAWILPLPDLPRDLEGNPLPLDEAVGVSPSWMFDHLQGSTNPLFSVNWGTFPAVCDFAQSGAGGGGGAGGGTGNTGGGVDVLDEAQVGPYDAQLLQSASSDDLFEWLNQNGYYQDPAAKPLLGHYVAQGYVFVAVRLQNGAQTGDIRPINLTFAENAPCVPLRLTKIAATANMPILVWVIGKARAVPKNFLHAVVDDRAINFTGESNYVQVVSDAIDTASGHAWVTEAAAPVSEFVPEVRFMIYEALAEALTPVASPSALGAVFAQHLPRRDWTQDLDEVLREYIGYPEGLVEGGEVPVSEEDFYRDIGRYLHAAITQGVAPEIDIPALKAALEDRVFAPLRALDALFNTPGNYMTRFFTTSDPEEMTKDPIFAFNPELPDVDRRRVVSAELVAKEDTEGCFGGAAGWTIATWADGNKYTFEGLFNVGAVPGVEPLKFVELLDETGPARAFDPEQAEEVDALLNNAVVGQPSVPEGYVLRPAPLVPPSWPNPPSTDDGGCQAGSPPSSWSLVLLLGLWIATRRRAA